MLKCIILDGDIATLNELMEYLEQVNRSLTEVNSLFATNKLSNQSIFLRDGNRIVRINREDILYLEGYGDYVKVHRAEGKPILSQLTLKHFEECLEGVFCRVHRSYIVSLSHINYIEHKRIRIEGATIPISDSYLPILMSKLHIQI